MTDSEIDGFSSLLTDALAYWRQDVSAFTLRVWWDGCRDWTLDEVSRALSAHAADPERGRFPPLLADVVRHLHGTQSDRSLIAWGKVLDAMQRVGAYASVVFDDGAIHAAISDMGGWPAICRTSTGELPFTQKRFTDLHRAYSLRPGMPYPARLLGEHEASNRLTGHAVASAVLVGDAARAREVEQLGVAGSKTAITAAVDAMPVVARIGAAA